MISEFPYVPGGGPSDAKIMLIGEAPGKYEVEQGTPFVGPAGVELTNMLHSVGIIRSECYITDVCKYRPPRNRITDWFYNKTQAAKTPGLVFINNRWVHPLVAEGIASLEHEISLIKPDLIIAFGNVPLWALTGEYGITKWRGSGLLTREIEGKQYALLATYHPSSILRNYEWKYIATHDLRKARRILDNGLPIAREDFCVRPSSDQVLTRLRELLEIADNLSDTKLDLAVDIETRYRQITCLGIAWSRESAICIPFLEIKAQDKNYWKSLEEEVEIVWALRKLLTHPNVLIIGQNFPYDQQYIIRRMAFLPNYKPENFHDTMTIHHVMFAGLPKGLDFLSSFYLDDHIYWKDEGKEWNPKTHDEEQHWVYNAKDCVRTYAVAMEQRKVYEQLNFPETTYGSPWTIQHKSHESILRAMLRGTCVDEKKKTLLREELGDTIKRLEAYIAYLLGHPLNPRSPKQLTTLFYNDFRIKPVTIYDRNTGKRRRTCNADALDTISKREVLLAPICNAINDIRSLGSFKSVTTQELDIDNRVRCSYSVPGTETYRYNSKEDAFGYGGNLQNVSAGNEKGKDGNVLDKTHHFYRPNLRKMYTPDPGYAIADHDLEQADARIVAWEADCPSLKEIFNDTSRDLHIENCEIIFGSCTGKGDPNRQRAKQGVHAANYAATAKVIADALGITVHQAERFMSRYFGERPEILEWHETVRLQLQSTRYVENVFGYRRFYFDRIENLLKEALAWIPQSTVAILINLGIQKVQEELPWAEFLMQVHDSAVHQFPIDDNLPTTDKADQVEKDFELIQSAMELELPYDDPMTIPVSGQWSLESWGHCK